MFQSYIYVFLEKVRFQSCDIDFLFHMKLKSKISKKKKKNGHSL